MWKYFLIAIIVIFLFLWFVPLKQLSPIPDKTIFETEMTKQQKVMYDYWISQNNQGNADFVKNWKALTYDVVMKSSLAPRIFFAITNGVTHYGSWMILDPFDTTKVFSWNSSTESWDYVEIPQDWFINPNGYSKSLENVKKARSYIGFLMPHYGYPSA